MKKKIFQRPLPVFFWAILLAILSLGMTAFVVSHLALETNIARLIPGNEFEAGIIENAGLLDQLVFDLSLKTQESDPVKLIAAADFFARKLKETGDFQQIFYQVSQTQNEALFQSLFEKRLALVRPESLPVEQWLNPEALEKKIHDLKFRLFSFESLIMKKFLIADPLGVIESSLKNLMSLSSGYRFKLIRQVLFSEDGRHILLVTRPREKSFEIDFSKKLFAKIHEIENQMDSKVRVAALGGHVYALQSAALIQRDMNWILILSLAGLAAVYFFSFRRFQPLLLSLIPILMGLLAGTFFATLFFTRVHGITLVFGSMLIGVGIDYSTHFYVSLTQIAKPLSAIRSVRSSLLFGYLTTACMILVFLLSGFRFFKEIAVFFFSGISVAYWISVKILPRFSAFQKPLLAGPLLKGFGKLVAGVHFLQRGKNRRPLWFFLPFALIFCILAFFSRFNPDIRSLNYTSPELKQIEKEIGQRYGDPASSHLLVSVGSTAQQALERNDRVREFLETAQKEKEIESFFNLSVFLPSEKTQRQRLTALKTLPWEKIQNLTEQTAQKLGFKPFSLSGFFSSIAGLNPQTYPVLTEQDFRGTFLENLIQTSLIATPQGYLAFSSFKNPVHEEALLASMRQTLLKDREIVYLNQPRFFSGILSILKSEAEKLIWVSLAVIFAILIFYYRNPVRALVALLPTLLGIVFSLGFLTLLGQHLNLISVFSLVLILGIGVDYGIFVLDSLFKPETETALTARAVMLAALTTVFSFGTLALSENQILWSIGLMTLLGIVFCLFFSLWLIPLLVQKKGIPTEKVE